MATIYWLGTATAVAQVDTLTVGGTISGEAFTISVGGVAIASHTDADTDPDTAVAALVAAWNTSTHPYATLITAADTHVASTGTMTLTSDVAGLPFTVTLNTPGGSATFGRGATTASAGPNDWSTVTNWSGGAVPVDDDTAVFRDSAINVCWGLDQSAVTLYGLYPDSTYTGKVGLPYNTLARSADGSTQLPTIAEYRDHYLAIGVATGTANESFAIGREVGGVVGAGSSRLKINTGSVATDIVVYKTASVSADPGKPAVRLLSDSTSTTVEVQQAYGGVGIAVDEPNESSTSGTLSLLAADTKSRLYSGSKSLFSNYYQTGGVGAIECGNHDEYGFGAIVTGGECTITGNVGRILGLEVAYATVYCSNGSAAHSAIDTKATVYAGGVLDGTRSTLARTWDAVEVHAGGVAKYNPDHVTVTAITFVGSASGGPHTVTVSG